MLRCYVCVCMYVCITQLFLNDRIFLFSFLLLMSSYFLLTHYSYQVALILGQCQHFKINAFFSSSYTSSFSYHLLPTSADENKLEFEYLARCLCFCFIFTFTYKQFHSRYYFFLIRLCAHC